jgi:hypothetical protein
MVQPLGVEFGITTAQLSLLRAPEEPTGLVPEHDPLSRKVLYHKLPVPTLDAIGYIKVAGRAFLYAWMNDAIGCCQPVWVKLGPEYSADAESEFASGQSEPI